MSCGRHLIRKALRKSLRVDRGVAGADHADTGPVKKMDRTPCRQHRRGIIKLRQPMWIIIPALEQQPCADSLIGVEFGLGHRPCGWFQCPATTLCQIRHGIERARDTAIALQKQAEGHRADIRRADQPQMGDLFFAVHTAGIRY